MTRRRKPPFDRDRWNQQRVTAALARVKAAVEAHAARQPGDRQPGDRSPGSHDDGTHTDGGAGHRDDAHAAPASSSGRTARDAGLANLDEHREEARSAPVQADRHEEWPDDRQDDQELDRLEILVRTFSLSPFERDTLLLCAGMELDSAFGALCARAHGTHGTSDSAWPTFSLAFAALPGAHWSAASPARPLRYWRLVETEPGRPVTTSPLRIDERILNFLAAVDHEDARLSGLVQRVDDAEALVPSHAELADRIARIWSGAESRVPVIQLSGVERITQRDVAAHAAASCGFELRAASAQALPSAPADLTQLLRAWNREAILGRAVLFLECDELDAVDPAREAVIQRAIEQVGGPVVLAGRQRRESLHRPMLTFEVTKPSTAEQQAVWKACVGRAMSARSIERLVSQFHLGARQIRTICAAAAAADADDRHPERRPEPDATGASAEADVERTADARRAAHAASVRDRVWTTCRVQVRPRLDDHAQRIESTAAWDDLILPEPAQRVLSDIAMHVRQRAKVYWQWGFSEKGERGLGVSALFAGASGTGKTMAAEVLANTLELDLYRIDLSSVVSKYIGETEKNLRKVFDAAEEGGVVLLFDEADALFGKRSEVKDSHDRYANIEVSYLLQRMELYRGLAILTTNLREALDRAFLRRLRFIVDFPFPDAMQRAEIWRRVFPAETPTRGLDVHKLAQLNVAGGHIRNIALAAAFLAADAGEPVQFTHVLRSARSEYEKLERPLSQSEIRGWVS